MHLSSLLSTSLFLTSLTAAADSSNAVNKNYIRSDQRNSHLESRQETTAAVPQSLILSAKAPDTPLIDDQLIVARDNHFWIGGKTNAVCPTKLANTADACPAEPITAIKIDSSKGTAMMAARLPATQPIYIPTTNLLTFAKPDWGTDTAKLNGALLTFAFTPTTDSTVGGETAATTATTSAATATSSTTTSTTNTAGQTYPVGTNGTFTFTPKTATSQQGQQGQAVGQPMAWIACKQKAGAGYAAGAVVFQIESAMEGAGEGKEGCVSVEIMAEVVDESGRDGGWGAYEYE